MKACLDGNTKLYVMADTNNVIFAFLPCLRLMILMINYSFPLTQYWQTLQNNMSIYIKILESIFKIAYVPGTENVMQMALLQVVVANDM